MNHREPADDVDERVAALPRPSLESAAGARIHARARETFQSSHANARASSSPGPGARLWSLLLEPAAVAIAVAVYLVWTTQALAALDWGRLALSSTAHSGSIAAPRAAGNGQDE